MSLRCFSIIADLIASLDSVGGVSFLAWMRPTRTLRDMQHLSRFSRWLGAASLSDNERRRGLSGRAGYAARSTSVKRRCLPPARASCSCASLVLVRVRLHGSAAHKLAGAD